ncbi:conserved Plasmodium protein, unknown function [Plasmodium reichenowi]|uniref:Uncharacterized protein n=1 Tax=Plasmodium reichenowi TaxID=5854 RepID=A0A2P9DP60_PLARE|nr:conserved Plasmodium protein, unknown function [Plasmodium reichenowi]
MNNDIKNELINNLPFKFSDISLNTFEKKKEKDKDYIHDEDGGHTWGNFSRDKIGNVKKKEKQTKDDNEDYSDDNNDNSKKKKKNNNNNSSSDHNNNNSSDHNNNNSSDHNNNNSSDHNNNIFYHNDNNKRLVLLKEKLKYNHYYYAEKLAEKEWEENYDNLKKKSQLFKDVLEKDNEKNFSTFNITGNEKICTIKEKTQKKKQNKNQKNLQKKNLKKEHNDISFNDTYTKYSSSFNDFNDISDSLNLKNDIINNEEEYNLTNSLFQSYPMEHNLPLFKYKKENKQDYDNNVKCREYDEKKVPKEISEEEEGGGENKKKKKKKKKKKNTLDIVHNVINKKISYDDNVNIPYFEDDDNKTKILGENMSNLFEEDKELDLFSSFKDIFNNHKKKIKLIDYNKILNKSLYDNVENVDSLIAQEKRKKAKKKKKKKRNNYQNSAHNEENMKQIKNNDNFNNMQSLNEYNEKVRGDFFEKKKTENDVKEIIKNIKMRLGFYSNEESDSHDIKCLENYDDNDDDDDDNDDDNNNDDDNDNNNGDNNNDDNNNNDNNNNDDNKNDIYNNLINEEEEKQNLEKLKDNINIPYTSKALYKYKEYSKKSVCDDLNKLSDEKETTKNKPNDLELIKKEEKKNDDTFFFISHIDEDKNNLLSYDHKGDDNYNDDNYNGEDKNNVLPCDHNDEDLFSLSMSSITFDKRKSLKNMECRKSIECVENKNKISINYNENNNKNILLYNINVQDENDKLHKNEQKIKQDVYNNKENDMLINSMSPENKKYIKNIKENDNLLKNVMKNEIDKKEKSNICICKYIDKYDMENLIDEIKKKKKNDVEIFHNSYSEDVCFYELYKFICSNNIEGNNENIFDDKNINVENVSSNIHNYMQSIFNNQIKYLDNLISQIFS